MSVSPNELKFWGAARLPQDGTSLKRSRVALGRASPEFSLQIAREFGTTAFFILLDSLLHIDVRDDARPGLSCSFRAHSRAHKVPSIFRRAKNARRFGSLREIDHTAGTCKIEQVALHDSQMAPRNQDLNILRTCPLLSVASSSGPCLPVRTAGVSVNRRPPSCFF